MLGKSLISVLSFLSCNSLHALIEQAINEKKPIEITLSTTSHNRISVEQGSVEKVFGDERFFSINLDRTTGNAFVSLLKPISDKPIVLTVVTSSGFIQDLSVFAEERPSEHLILRHDAEKEDPIDFTTNFHTHTVEFLNSILEGKIPLGYGQRGLRIDDTLSLPHPLIASPLKAFEGPFEETVIYAIKNRGKHSIVLDAESIKKDASWVFLNAHELQAKEQAICIVSFPKKENFP